MYICVLVGQALLRHHVVEQGREARELGVAEGVVPEGHAHDPWWLVHGVVGGGDWVVGVVARGPCVVSSSCISSRGVTIYNIRRQTEAQGV